MLTIGLTGGIGSGKSTAGQRLAELGATVIDADHVAREVVAPGTPGLARVVKRFGSEVLAGDGSLDRAALAGIVFGDDAARSDLEGIIHPLVGARSAELIAAAGRDAIVVYDVPLLVEKGLGAQHHLVLVVDTPAELRVQRLVSTRGMAETDARARMQHQASDDQRRAAADVLLDNSGTPQQLTEQVDRVWRERIVPFADNVRAGRVAAHAELSPLGDGGRDWAAAAARVTARLSHVLGDRAPEIEHVGSTSVPGMRPKEVLDLQVGVRALRDADEPEFVRLLTEAGFPRVEDYRMDHPTGELIEPELWVKRVHGSSDPGQVVHLHVREIGGAGWDYALLFRDWLRANPDEARAYEQAKQRLVDERGGDSGVAGEADAAEKPQSAGTEDPFRQGKAQWFEDAWPRMQVWAQRTGWSA